MNSNERLAEIRQRDQLVVRAGMSQPMQDRRWLLGEHRRLWTLLKDLHASGSVVCPSGTPIEKRFLEAIQGLPESEEPSL